MCYNTTILVSIFDQNISVALVFISNAVDSNVNGLKLYFLRNVIMFSRHPLRRCCSLNNHSISINCTLFVSKNTPALCSLNTLHSCPSTSILISIEVFGDSILVKSFSSIARAGK
jgi:hypothetical protein